MNARWKCPQCDSGVIAPTRPRMNDVRRYCLPCSAKTGVLVQRTAPALDKKRAASKAKTQEKQTVKRVKQVQARSHAGFDWQKEAQRIWRILCKQNNKTMRMPVIKVVNRKRAASSGYCYYSQHMISMQMGTNTVDAWETLAHELNHAIGYHGHDHNFYRSLKALTEARWKVRISSFNWNRAGYNCDWDLRSQLVKADVVKF